MRVLEKVCQNVREEGSHIQERLAISPPLGGFLSKLKNREEFEGGHEKGRGKEGKGEKKKRVIKHTLKYLFEALVTAKTGENFRGGGIFLAGRNIYPCPFFLNINRQRKHGFVRTFFYKLL